MTFPLPSSKDNNWSHLTRLLTVVPNKTDHSSRNTPKPCSWNSCFHTIISFSLDATLLFCCLILHFISIVWQNLAFASEYSLTTSPSGYNLIHVFKHQLLAYNLHFHVLFSHLAKITGFKYQPIYLKSPRGCHVSRNPTWGLML